MDSLVSSMAIYKRQRLPSTSPPHFTSAKNPSRVPRKTGLSRLKNDVEGSASPVQAGEGPRVGLRMLGKAGCLQSVDQHCDIITIIETTAN